MNLLIRNKPREILQAFYSLTKMEMKLEGWCMELTVQIVTNYYLLTNEKMTK